MYGFSLVSSPFAKSMTVIWFLLWPVDHTATSFEPLAARIEIDNAPYHIPVSSNAMIQYPGYLKRSRKDLT